MMNNLDDLLQARLAQLEAGESLTVASAGLPEKMAHALKMAVNLQQITLPEPEETAVLAQRTAVIRAAQEQREPIEPTVTGTSAGWLATLLRWWQGHQAIAWGITAVATILLLLVVGNLFNRPSAPTQIDREPESPSEARETAGGSLLDRLFGGEDEEVAEDVPPTVNASASDDPAADAEVAGMVEDDPAYHTFLPMLTNPLQTGPQAAVLGDLQGVVSVQPPDGDWELVSTLSSVAVGSRVRTGELSGATLTFFDGSMAKLGPNSELSIDRLNALRPEEGFRTVVLTQWRGDSTHDVQFRNDSGSQYEVKSPSGSGIARGTTFHVLVLPDLTSRYSVLEGRVDVTSIDVTVAVLAGQLSTILAGEPPAAPTFLVNGEGEVTEVGDSWTIGGQTFATDAQTVIVGNPQVGDWVTVQGHLLADGSKVADLIVLVRQLPQNLFTLTAVVSEIGPEQWLLGNVVIVVDEETAVDPDISTGDWVQVTGVVQADGILLAQRIRRLEAEGAPFEFTGVVQAIEPEQWQISGIAVTVNGRTEIKDDLAVGDVVKVEGQIMPDGTWLAREIKAEDDDEAKFEFTGLVESVEPWLVAGISLVTDEWTEIDTAVALGDLVRVEGIILPDGTWLAEEIKLLADPFDDETIIRFTGIVESRDPWVVNGITLLATDTSQIAAGLAVGDLVQVAARLMADGTWELLWIRPLLPPTTGCFTIHTQIIAVSNTQITFANWPNLSLTDDIQVEGTLAPNSIIALNICLTGDDTVTVVNIIVIQVVINIAPDVGDDNDHDDDNGGNGRVTICHKGRTLTISESGLNGHLGHGDTLGHCSQGDDDDDDDDDGDDHDDD